MCDKCHKIGSVCGDYRDIFYLMIPWKVPNVYQLTCLLKPDFFFCSLEKMHASTHSIGIHWMIVFTRHRASLWKYKSNNIESVPWWNSQVNENKQMFKMSDLGKLWWCRNPACQAEQTHVGLDWDCLRDWKFWEWFKMLINRKSSAWALTF